MYKEALQALHILRRYKEQNKHRNLKLLRQLRTHKKSYLYGLAAQESK
jgi:hypothetical protein